MESLIFTFKDSWEYIYLMPLFINIILVFSLIGLADTTYLIYCKVMKKDVYCLFFPKKWCKKVQYSKYSTTLGIPNSVAGFGMYSLIFILAAAFVNGFAPLMYLQAIIAFGYAFSMYFMYIQARVLKAYCTWCVLSAINFTVMAFAIFFLV